MSYSPQVSKRSLYDGRTVHPNAALVKEILGLGDSYAALAKNSGSR